MQKYTGRSPINVIAVTSGKGGTGKTQVAINLAISMAKKGHNIVLFDADLGLANVDVVLGLKPIYDVRHVLSGEKTLDEVLLKGPENIWIVPATPGITTLANLPVHQQASLIRAFSELTVPVDTLIVDTSTGISSSVINFASAAQEVVVVFNDEPAAITDAYALIKILNQESGIKRFQVLVNLVESDIQGRQLFEKVNRVTDRFLDVHLGYLGSIPRDKYLLKAVQKQQSVVMAYPGSTFAKAMPKLIDTLCASFSSQERNSGLVFFIERLLTSGRDDGSDH